MKTTHVEVSIIGSIAGRIWMPAVTCAKDFRIDEADLSRRNISLDRAKGTRPSVREMILHITSDGDFQDCKILDATVTFKRVTQTMTGIITRKRTMDIRQFTSVDDHVIAENSQEYWNGIDCMNPYEEEERINEIDYDLLGKDGELN